MTSLDWAWLESFEFHMHSFINISQPEFGNFSDISSFKTFFLTFSLCLYFMMPSYHFLVLCSESQGSLYSFFLLWLDIWAYVLNSQILSPWSSLLLSISTAFLILVIPVSIISFISLFSKIGLFFYNFNLKLTHCAYIVFFWWHTHT